LRKIFRYLTTIVYALTPMIKRVLFCRMTETSHDTNAPPSPDPAAWLPRIDPAYHPEAIEIIEEWRANRGKNFPRKVSEDKCGHRQTHQISLEKRGVLRTVHNGKFVMTTAASLYPYLLEKLASEHPAGAVKPRRQPTPQELEGLRKGNERCRLMAEARRAQRERREQESETATV
jgi:hypothetical protein